MHKNRSILIGLVLLSISNVGWARSREAYQKFEKGDFKGAAQSFGIDEAQKPEDLELSYNRGVAHYKAGEYEHAARAFEKAGESMNNDIAFQSQFNLGNSYVMQKKPKEAVMAYEKALKLRPEDQATQENLAFAKKQMEQQPQDQEQQAQNQDQKDKDQQQNQAEQDQKQQSASKDQKKSSQKDQNQQAEQDKKSKQSKDEEQTSAEHKDQKNKDKQNKEQQQADQSDQKKQDEKSQTEQTRLGEDQKKPDEAQAANMPETQQEQVEEDKQTKPSQAVALSPQQKLEKQKAEKLLRSVDDFIQHYQYQPTNEQLKRAQKSQNGKDW